MMDSDKRKLDSIAERLFRAFAEQANRDENSGGANIRSRSNTRTAGNLGVVYIPVGST
jgi:hypothetical protein